MFKILFIRNQICDSFLGLVELDNGSSAAGIYEILRAYLVSMGVKKTI